MLTLYHGTHLEKLADQLLAQLNHHPPADPLAQEIFVVQNNGLGQWLSLYMARHSGIAANLKFEFPAERMWALARVLDPEIPKTLPSDRGPLAWSIMEVLQGADGSGDFEVLSQYTRHSDPQQKMIRRWKLSEKIADVFDQYLVFRPDLLLAWEQGERVYPQNEAEQWQAALWGKLIDHWKQGGYDPRWLHRASLQRRLIQAIDEERIDTDDLPHRVTVFGVSGMSPAYINTLVKLSKLIDVHFYQLNIDASVTAAGEFKNPLLNSLGKEGADFLSLIREFVDRDPEVAAYFEVQEIGAATAGSPDPPRKGGDGLIGFQQLRAGLLEDMQSGDGPRAADLLPDSTLQVHSCHSPMREVEVLHDQLTAAFDEHPDMHPEDVVIMTPDIGTYAPLVEAVFGNPDDGQPEIPYSIADRGIEGAYPSIQAFLKVLELSESRYKVTDVLDLLDADPLQEAFGFSSDDLRQLEQWIGDNRIRWGIDGPFKQQFDVPDIGNCTWRAGLNRIVLGYAMKPGEDKLYNGIFPYHEIESSDQAELAGQFARFLNELFDLRGRVGEPLAAGEWAGVLYGVVEQFLADNRQSYREVSQIRTAIGQLQESAGLGGFEGGLPFQVVRSWLREHLDEQTTGGGRIGRGMTFSSLVPMRGIPFKMVGMIGMSEGAFPRSKIHPEFDLMQKEPRKGDRSRANDDRYLFLENILSARSRLYYSYVGQSNRQDAHFPPSVVLKELLDYMNEQYGGKDNEAFIERHPLQAFSPSYFKGEELFSYSRTRRQIAGQLLRESSDSNTFMLEDLPAPGEKWKQLTLSELLDYYRHPSRFTLRKRVGIYLREEEVLDEDREPFDLSGLDSYQVNQTLMDRYLRGESLEEYEEVVRARDLLPQDWIGEQEYADSVSVTRRFGAAVDPYLQGEPVEDREVDLRLGGIHLTGRLGDLFEGARVTFRFGRCRPKDLTGLWINHLLLQLVKQQGHSGVSRYMYYQKKYDNIKLIELAPVADARQLLQGLLESYWEGLSCCSYFFPETSYKFAEQFTKKRKTEEESVDQAKATRLSEYSYSSEGEDPYNKLMTGNRPLETQTFREAAVAFWGPYFEAVNEEKIS